MVLDKIVTAEISVLKQRRNTGHLNCAWHFAFIIRYEGTKA